MSEVICLRCHEPVPDDAEQCVACGERVTEFQRTYSDRLLDGKYQILERLGIGGMGEIFKVLHIHLNEQRVVKIMRSNIATDSEALQRFLHEARLATMIKHRNLAMLYDFSTLDDGSYYMVWEFIDGTNIQKWVAQNGPMPPRVALEISIQSLSGLEALHQMGVIHRDISPENIMITLDHQQKLLVKVIDFGIAKQLSDSESGHGLTQTGMFLGKLKYASPEQAGFLKEGEYLDARSDLYSFGIVMYEMLAGRAPFLATNPQSYILKHATEKPAPISEIAPDVSVPAPLEEIVFKTLEKDRNHRFKDAAEIINALRALRDVIAPDEKHGVGDHMVTLSEAKTVSETLHPSVRTKAGQTVAKRGSKAAAGEGEATVQESKADQATVVEPLAGGDQATMITRGGSGDATAITRAGGRAGATMATRPGAGEAPTVMERKSAPTVEKPKSKTGLYAIAAILVIAIGVGAWLMFKPKAPIGSGSETGTETTTMTTTTEPPVTSEVADHGALGAGEGALVLTASPNGSVEKIVDSNTNKAVALGDIKDRSVPLRIPLKAGRYEVTLSDPNGNVKVKVANVEAGAMASVHADFARPDLDKLATEILKQQ